MGLRGCGSAFVEGGFWLDGFEGMWIGFCRGWIGVVWIRGEVRSSDSNRGWIGVR